MDIFADLMMGLSVAITPINIVYLLIGAMVGMIVGVIPGFGPSAGLAILLPVTFGMSVSHWAQFSFEDAQLGGWVTCCYQGNQHSTVLDEEGLPYPKEKAYNGPRNLDRALSNLLNA